jgi:hypothetical protein
MSTATRQNGSNLSSLFYDADPMQRLYATAGEQIQNIALSNVEENVAVIGEECGLIK